MTLKIHLYMRKIAFKYSNSTSVNTCYGFGFEGKTCYDSKLAINANTTFKTYSSNGSHAKNLGLKE